MFAREMHPLIKRRPAQAPLRLIDDALERQDIARIGEQPHIGDHVLDLFALIEFQSPDDAIADRVAQKHLFYDARLGIRPIEDGEMIEWPPGGMFPGYGFRYVARLRFFVFGRNQRDQFAPAYLGPQFLVALMEILLDDAGRRVEDDLRRAVVAIERDDSGVGVIFLEIEDVPDVRLAPAVDRLIVIADDEQVSMLLGEQMHQEILRIVGVLVFVHHYIAEHLLIFPEDIRVLLEQLHGEHNEIIEIEGIRRAKFLLIMHVHFRHDFLIIAPGRERELLRIDKRVLGARYGVEQSARLHLISVDLELFHRFFRKRLLILAIENIETLVVAEHCDLAAQDAAADIVKCPDVLRKHHPAVLGRLALCQEPPDTLAHLAGRLVGKGHRQDSVRGDFFLIDEIGDAVRERFRLARSGAGQNQNRPFCRENRS